MADMDRYKAVTDNRLDWRRERVSWDDMVFWRVMGWKDEDEDVEVLEAGWSIVATGILLKRRARGHDRRPTNDRRSHKKGNGKWLF